MHITTIITIKKNYLPISSINKVNRPVEIFKKNIQYCIFWFMAIHVYLQLKKIPSKHGS